MLLLDYFYSTTVSFFTLSFTIAASRENRCILMKLFFVVDKDVSHCH